MNDQIETEVYWVTPPWSCECVIDNCNEFMLLGDCGHSFEIAYLEDGVGQRLDVEYLGVLLNRRLIGRRVSNIRHRDLDAESGKVFCHQSVSATVAVCTRDHVIVLRKQR